MARWLPIVLAAFAAGCELLERVDLGVLCEERVDRQIDIEAERHARLRVLEVRFADLEALREELTEEEFDARARALLAERDALLARGWTPAEEAGS